MGCAREIAGGSGLAVIVRHDPHGRPPGAPVLSQRTLSIPLWPNPLLALAARRLLPPPGRTPPHPAFPLWPLRALLQRTDLPHQLLVEASRAARARVQGPRPVR